MMWADEIKKLSDYRIAGKLDERRSLVKKIYRERQKISAEIQKFRSRGNEVGVLFTTELDTALRRGDCKKRTSTVVSGIIFDIHDVFERFRNIAREATISEGVKVLFSFLDTVVNRSRTAAMDAIVATKSRTKVKLTAAKFSHWYLVRRTQPMDPAWSKCPFPECRNEFVDEPATTHGRCCNQLVTDSQA